MIILIAICLCFRSYLEPVLWLAWRMLVQSVCELALPDCRPLAGVFSRDVHLQGEGCSRLQFVASKGMFELSLPFEIGRGGGFWCALHPCWPSIALKISSKPRRWVVFICFISICTGGLVYAFVHLIKSTCRWSNSIHACALPPRHSKAWFFFWWDLNTTSCSYWIQFD